MFVPADRHDEAKAIAKARPPKRSWSATSATSAPIGPVVSEAQFNKVQRLIQAGIDEGAELVTGGPGRPEHLNRGYFVRPTVFAGVRNDMTIAREEIFGPVLSIMPYRRRGGSDPARQRHGLWPGGLRAVRRSRAGAPRRGRDAGGQRLAELSGLGYRARRSAATSSRATGANMASAASRITWRSRR